MLLGSRHDVGEAARDVVGRVRILAGDIGQGHLGEGVHVIVGLGQGSSPVRGPHCTRPLAPALPRTRLNVKRLGQRKAGARWVELITSTARRSARTRGRATTSPSS